MRSSRDETIMWLELALEEFKCATAKARKTACTGLSCDSKCPMCIEIVGMGRTTVCEMMGRLRNTFTGARGETEREKGDN